MRKWLYSIALVSAAGFAGAALAAGPSFDQVDADRDGKISKAEATAVKGLDFAKADVNKDGSLDRSEYAAAIG